MWTRKLLTCFIFLGFFGPLIADRIAHACDRVFVSTETEAVAEESLEPRAESSFLVAILAAGASLNQQFVWTKVSEFQFVISLNFLDLEATVRGPPGLN